jgi:hypothetical protein
VLCVPVNANLARRQKCHGIGHMLTQSCTIGGTFGRRGHDGGPGDHGGGAGGGGDWREEVGGGDAQSLRAMVLVVVERVYRHHAVGRHHAALRRRRRRRVRVVALQVGPGRAGSPRLAQLLHEKQHQATD